MDAPSRSARDTVIADTPARCATSDIVGAEGRSGLVNRGRHQLLPLSTSPLVTDIYSISQWRRGLCRVRLWRHGWLIAKKHSIYGHARSGLALDTLSLSSP